MKRRTLVIAELNGHKTVVGDCKGLREAQRLRRSFEDNQRYSMTPNRPWYVYSCLDAEDARRRATGSDAR